MSFLTRFLLILGAIVAAVVVQRAIVGSVFPGIGNAEQNAERLNYEVSQMTTASRLGDLVRDQDLYRVRHDRYAATLVDLIDAGMRVESGAAVTVTVLDATASGWAAEGRHDDFPERSCVVYGGEVSPLPETAGGRTPSEAGVPVCDPPPGAED